MEVAKLNIGKRSDFANLRTDLIDWLDDFVKYNNENCMFYISRVFESESDDITLLPAMSLSLPDIIVGESIGYGEDIESSDLIIQYPINVHIVEFDGKQEDKSTIQFIDNFLYYLYTHPRFSGSFEYNGSLQLIQNFVFEQSNSIGMVIMIGIKGMFHK